METLDPVVEKRLRHAGIGTVEELATLEEDEFLTGVPEPILHEVRDQARVLVAEAARPDPPEPPEEAKAEEGFLARIWSRFQWDE